MSQLSQLYKGSWQDIKIGQLQGKYTKTTAAQLTGNQASGDLHNLIAVLDTTKSNNKYAVFSLNGSDKANQSTVSDDTFFSMLSTFQFTN